MASVTVKITGLRELGEAMRNLSLDMNTKIARSATGRGANVIRKRVRERAPVAPPEQTPKVPYASLRDNIVAKRVPPAQTQFTSEHLVVVRGGKKNDYASHVASLTEFGTVNQPPNSFMRTGFDEEKGFAVGKMIQAIKEGIDKAGKK